MHETESLHNEQGDSSKNSSNPHEILLALLAVSAAFGTYFCMYAFRKPFTAAPYADSEWWGIGFKTILLTSQVLGYTCSKFIGIKAVSESSLERQAVKIFQLILIAEMALLGFALVPRPWNAACLFLNGLPLGMVFGLVLRMLEGRRLTEALTAGLCTSFILADGFTKSVGTWLLQLGVSEEWMPVSAGAIFLLPLMICLWALGHVPRPSGADIIARSQREVMNHAERRSFLRKYGWGLFPIVVMYLLVTILRSIRADFAPELWRELGSAAAPNLFTTSELFVALAVVFSAGLTVFFRDNRRAFFASLAVCATGFLLMGFGVYGLKHQWISGFGFMVILGMGLYLPYVAVHTTVFERMLAMTREPGNIGFLMYVVDATGYLGYVGVMCWRNFGSGNNQVLGFVTQFSWLALVISLACIGFSWLFFARTTKVSSRPS
jgi:hypothetical protein